MLLADPGHFLETIMKMAWTTVYRSGKDLPVNHKRVRDKFSEFRGRSIVPLLVSRSTTSTMGGLPHPTVNEVMVISKRDASTSEDTQWLDLPALVSQTSSVEPYYSIPCTGMAIFLCPAEPRPDAAPTNTLMISGGGASGH